MRVNEAQREGGASGVTSALLAALPVAVGAAMLFGSSRTFVSWHGLVHVGIAAQFPSAVLPPENPFFAGEPLAYYWVHQAFAAGIARGLGIDALNAFAALTLASLALLMGASLRLGARQYGSASAGLLIGWLALAGLNPAGPAIAALRAVREGVPLLEFAAEPVETVFVSNEAADLWMAHPLLGAMQLSRDWRVGQNLPWFLDNSSRAPALALLLPMIALFLAQPRAPVLVGSAALGALTAALNPLVGLAGAGALLGGASTVSLASRIPALRTAFAGSQSGVGLAAGTAALLGALLAAPSYLQLFAGAGEPAALRADFMAVAKTAAALVASFCVLAPLACYGALRAPERLRAKLAALVLGGLALLAAVSAVHLVEGNEHNLANVAAVLLAVPALGFAAARGGLVKATGTLLFATFLPVSVCTLASFSGRPSLPIASDAGVLVRTPEDDPLAEAYAWIREETPRNAVFVVDPARPVKMATNVSELPAFTGHTLFVDQPSYLTTPYAAFAERTQLAAALAAGEPLSAAGRAQLVRLGRPVFLLSHAGDDEHLAVQLTSHYGPPRFASGFVAVYALAGVQ